MKIKITHVPQEMWRYVENDSTLDVIYYEPADTHAIKTCGAYITLIDLEYSGVIYEILEDWK